MQVFEGVEGLGLRNTAVTTGNFDGLHLGHQFLLKELVRVAREKSMHPVVVMFYPHPREVLSKGADDLRYLSNQEEKYEIFEKLGIEAVVQVPFDLQLASLSAAEFIQSILIDKVGMAFFLVGYDHRLGNPKYETRIMKLATEKSFAAEECAPFTSPVGKVSSSQIRHSLEQGDVKKAAVMMGRDYAVNCVVEEGMKLGRSIGYPTANLRLLNPKRQIPAEGVYAVKVNVDGMLYGGMLMIGYRPTLNDGRGLTIEVHIFNFEEDIYHQEINVGFIDFVRFNKRFENVGLLRKQLQEDERTVRAILSLI